MSNNSSDKSVPNKSSLFNRMLEKAKNLLEAGYLEYSIIQIHLTLDFFINLLLEIHFLSKLDYLKDSNLKVHQLFLDATWETDKSTKFVSFLDKYGKYTNSIGFDFKGQNYYSELKSLNKLRNDIVHNRLFASDINKAQAESALTLSQQILQCFLAEFNSDFAPNTSGMYRIQSSIDDNFLVSVSKNREKRVDVITDIRSTFLVADVNGHLYPNIKLPITRSHPQIREPNLRRKVEIDDERALTHLNQCDAYVILQICGLDYIRFGTEKPNMDRGFEDLFPAWCSPQIFQVKIDLDLNYITRQVNKSIRSFQQNLKERLRQHLTDRFIEMFESWNGASFPRRVAFTQMLPYIFDLNKLDADDVHFHNLLTQHWEFIVNEGTASSYYYLSLADIQASKKKFLVFESNHPAEIDIISRGAANEGILLANSFQKLCKQK